MIRDPVALLGHLAALQGSLGTLLGDPWGALVSLWCHLLSRRVNLGVSWRLIWVAGRLLTVFLALLCVVWDGPRHVDGKRVSAKTVADMLC